MMLLRELLSEFTPAPILNDINITGISLDSRQIKPGNLFIAIPGAEKNGQHFIADAIENGAVAILFDATISLPNLSVPLISIADLKQKIGLIADKFFGSPSTAMKVIGITGTSGKTSCTHYLTQALESLGEHTAVIGTLGAGFLNHLNDTGLTTPDAVTLQTILAKCLAEKADAIAMEVSSHSIAQGRINGTEFEVAVFTNLSQDHLDYHHSMDEYAAVKKSFLTDFPHQKLVINADDEYGKKWLGELSSQHDVIAYSTNASNDLAPTIYVTHAEFSLTQIHAKISSPWGEAQLSLPLTGKFNLSNALAVLATLCALNIPFQTAIKTMSAIKAVPGRMQALGGNDKPLVIVDYAHKPDALMKVLQTLRAEVKGRIITIFGCGGERDKGKREQMAKIAEALSDDVIVTNDNPRREAPENILADIMRGFTAPQNVIVELDRAKAIQKGLQLAKINDCVLIAGKGAETYQQIGETKHVFDDAKEAKKILRG